MADEDDDGEYYGMFAGKRIGGMPSVKLNIIAEELTMLENGSRPLPFRGTGVRVDHPFTRATKDGADMRASRRIEMRESLSRPGSSTGFVGKMRNSVSADAAFKRSGLEWNATRERLFGTDHACSTEQRFSTAHREQFKHYKGSDEISLYSTMRKAKAERALEKRQNAPKRASTSLGMKRVETSKPPMRDSLRRLTMKRDPFEKCPNWETTTTANFKAYDGRQNANYIRVKPMIQTMNPLVPSDI